MAINAENVSIWWRHHVTEELCLQQTTPNFKFHEMVDSNKNIRVDAGLYGYGS